VVALGEFCGTFMFLFMAFAIVQTAQNRELTDPERGGLGPATITLLYIATGFGLSLGVNCWLFYRVCGGMFNPAVSLGLLLARAIPPVRFALCLPMQLIAAIAAAAATDGLFPGPLMVANTLAADVSHTQGVFIEMLLTAQLVLAVLLLAVEKHKATFVAPIGIGASLFAGHMIGVLFTGAGLNPARSFGPAVISGFTTYHWIYWVGPALGSLVAWAVWKVLRFLEYQTANPGQDSGWEMELWRAADVEKGARTGDVAQRPEVMTEVVGGGLAKH